MRKILKIIILIILLIIVLQRIVGCDNEKRTSYENNITTTGTSIINTEKPKEEKSIHSGEESSKGEDTGNDLETTLTPFMDRSTVLTPDITPSMKPTLTLVPTVSSSPEPTFTPTPTLVPTPESVVLRWDEPGKYGEIVALNQGTDDEYSFVAHKVPAGEYILKNLDEKYSVQVSVYSNETYINSSGVEEFVMGQQMPIVLKPGDSADITVQGGEYIKLSDGGNHAVELIKK